MPQFCYVPTGNSGTLLDGQPRHVSIPTTPPYRGDVVYMGSGASGQIVVKGVYLAKTNTYSFSEVIVSGPAVGYSKYELPFYPLLTFLKRNFLDWITSCHSRAHYVTNQ